MKKSSVAQCAMAVSLFRGLYARVARDLGVDVSYISRIARGERKSTIAERAINKEFNKVVTTMRNGPILITKKPYASVTLRCPRCKASQKVHIASRPEFGMLTEERVSCIGCDFHFKVTIPDKIVGGPFPAY
jgi:hypothetical protein